MSAKISTVSFALPFPKKAENALAFLHILLTSRKKKIFLKGPKSLQNSSLTSGVTRLDGVRDKKQVERPHVQT